MKHSRALPTLAASVFLLCMIFDSKTALAGAAQGVQLCVATVIPSLFPFFVLSIFVTGRLQGRKIPILRPLGRILGLPEGSESLLLMGFLGGYPVGAQCIAQSCRQGSLSKQDGERMLAFCSNAGPAFLFGIGATLFPEIWLCWLLWAIHILSALGVGFLSPLPATEKVKARAFSPPSLPESMELAIKSMALVCGWIVLFRTVISFFQRWFLWLLPVNLQLLVSGLLELANGCCDLGEISCLGLRLQLCALFLGFGGLCVALQTRSVLAGSRLEGKAYFPGKVAQAALSYLLSIPAQLLLSEQDRYFPPVYLAVVAASICFAYGIYWAKSQKSSSILAGAGV